jgi:hypothetical protein
VKLKRTWLVTIILAISIGITAVLYLVFITKARKQRFEKFARAYDAIKIGDSRDAVVAALGEPNEVTKCPSYAGVPKMEKEFQSKCFQQYEYFSFMAQRTIYFDRNGAVIHKSMAVSP